MARAAGQRTREPEDCPICCERIVFSSQRGVGVRTGGFFFACAAHPICDECDGAMRAADDRRCPVCRAPRLGLTAEEAEPPADRNAPPPPGGLEELAGAFRRFVESGVDPGLAAGLPVRARMRLERGAMRGVYRGAGLGPRMHFPAQGTVDLRSEQMRAYDEAVVDAAEAAQVQDALHELAARAQRQARRHEFLAASMDEPEGVDELAAVLNGRARAQGGEGQSELHRTAHAMLAELCEGVPHDVAHWRALHRRAREAARVPAQRYHGAPSVRAQRIDPDAQP